jgi:hypothetical protein
VAVDWFNEEGTRGKGHRREKRGSRGCGTKEQVALMVVRFLLLAHFSRVSLSVCCPCWLAAHSLSGSLSLSLSLRLPSLSAVFVFAVVLQRCVRRRAAISVLANPSCPDADAARKAVDEVFERCYADTEPFKAIP